MEQKFKAFVLCIEQYHWVGTSTEYGNTTKIIFPYALLSINIHLLLNNNKLLAFTFRDFSFVIHVSRDWLCFHLVNDACAFCEAYPINISH